MDSVPKPRGIEFLPYVMGKYRQEPRIDGSPYQKGHSWGGNVGLDAKFALSDYTLGQKYSALPIGQKDLLTDLLSHYLT